MNLKYKTLVTVFLFSMFFLLPVNSQEAETNTEYSDSSAPNLDFINFFTENYVNHKLTLQEKAKNYSNFRLVTLSTAITQQTDMKELFVSTGIESLYNQLNFTSDIYYAPTFWNCLNAGAHLINHFTWNYTDYFEYDFLPGIYLSYKPAAWFYMTGSAFFQLKSSYIFDIYPSAGTIISTCPAFSVIFGFLPQEDLEIKISISSYDYFRYYLFFAPEYKLEAVYKATKHLSIFLSGDVQFVDFFTLSANFSSLTACIGISWEF